MQSPLHTIKSFLHPIYITSYDTYEYRYEYVGIYSDTLNLSSNNIILTNRLHNTHFPSNSIIILL